MVTTPPEVSQPGKKSFLTSGAKEVVNLVAIRRYDDSTHLLFYISSLPGEEGARQRHLFVVDSKGSEEKCLSCDKTVGLGCTYFSAQMFEDSQENNEDDVFFVLSCGSDSVIYFPDDGSSPPFTATIQYTHSTGEMKLIKMLEDNPGYKDKLAAYDWPAKKFFQTTVKTNDEDDGLIIYGQVFLPPHFDVEDKGRENIGKGKKKHPILFNIYSGPSTTKVNNRFVIDYHSFLAMNHG